MNLQFRRDKILTQTEEYEGFCFLFILSSIWVLKWYSDVKIYEFRIRQAEKIWNPSSLMCYFKILYLVQKTPPKCTNDHEQMEYLGLTVLQISLGVGIFITIRVYLWTH